MCFQAQAADGNYIKKVSFCLVALFTLPHPSVFIPLSLTLHLCVPNPSVSNSPLFTPPLSHKHISFYTTIWAYLSIITSVPPLYLNSISPFTLISLITSYLHLSSSLYTTPSSLARLSLLYLSLPHSLSQVSLTTLCLPTPTLSLSDYLTHEFTLPFVHYVSTSPPFLSTYYLYCTSFTTLLLSFFLYCYLI